MFVVRFCYDVNPANRNEAADCIREEVAAARKRGLDARMLVPLTRGRDEPALEYEVEVESLGQLEAFREEGVGGKEQVTHEWMRRFSALLAAPPAVAIFRQEAEKKV